MILALLCIPTLAGLAAFRIRADRLRRALLLLVAAAHAALTAGTWLAEPVPAWQGWLGLDPLGRLFLSLTSVLFLAAAVYGAGYLARERRGAHEDFEEGIFFLNAPEAVFTGCLLLFLATMTLVSLSRHFGLLWVAVEATTLASAPLIYFHRHHRSLEATWKYLLICSVGIALALLGNYFLVLGAAQSGTEHVSLNFEEVLKTAPRMNPVWVKAAFLFFLVGYGTKMGLAPLNTWLPDAHSEAPSVVSALLSGALLNCAFLGLLRAQQVCAAAGEGAFGRELLLGFGLLSMACAAVFIIRQSDFKRLLAFSSAEHMGILALGVGLGGAGNFGALLHAVNHSLTKAMLFLVSGNLLAAYKTKSIPDVRGALRVVPFSGVLWLAGFLALCGSPPFGSFLSEFAIFRAALDQGRGGIAVAYLALLAIVFVGLASAFLRMGQGTPPEQVRLEVQGEAALSVWPPALLGAGVLALGLYVPAFLTRALTEAARSLGGS